MNAETKSVGLFERHRTLWVALCILGGIGLGKVAPGLAQAQALDGMAIHVNGAPVASIPIALCGTLRDHRLTPIHADRPLRQDAFADLEPICVPQCQSVDLSRSGQWDQAYPFDI